MQKAHIIHNPTSGDKEFTREELIALVEANGFKCGYSSTKKDNWVEIADDVEFLIVAGGDGTVRKAASELLNGKLKGRKLPIGLLPAGSANNIAQTLGICGKPEQIIQSWHHRIIKPYDVGFRNDITENSFFIESMGFGVFPYLMRKMIKIEEEKTLPVNESLETALKTLNEILPDYKAHDCSIKIDGYDLSGKFLLVEIMNIRSLGPQLNLAPFADPGDGLFEVVMIPETQRAKLASFITEKINGSPKSNSFQMLPAKQVLITWHGKYGHADDQEIEMQKEKEWKIELMKGVLEFLVSENQTH